MHSGPPELGLGPTLGELSSTSVVGRTGFSITSGNEANSSGTSSGPMWPIEPPWLKQRAEDTERGSTAIAKSLLSGTEPGSVALMRATPAIVDKARPSVTEPSSSFTPRRAVFVETMHSSPHRAVSVESINNSGDDVALLEARVSVAAAENKVAAKLARIKCG